METFPKEMTVNTGSACVISVSWFTDVSCRISIYDYIWVCETQFWTFDFDHRYLVSYYINIWLQCCTCIYSV